MRRVDAEGGFRGRDGKRKGARSSSSQKLNLRRLALEDLETRTLLSTSTLPTPVASLQSLVGEGVTSTAANSSSPDVVIDPLNPQKMVAAWTTYDPGNPLDGSGGQVTTYAQAAYSNDGGQTWSEMPFESDLDADLQTNFSLATVTSGPQPHFAETTDASVAFGRDESVYMLTSSHDAANGSGELNLQRWDFSTDTPVAQNYSTPAYDTLDNSFFGSPSTVHAIYRWQGSDAAIDPTLAIDNNLPSFTSGGTTQTDPFAGNIYVAWETIDTVTAPANPYTIKLMSSADEGQNFTYQAYVGDSGADHSPGNLFDQPKIAISQGSPSVPGGQVTIVYDNAGPGGSTAPAPHFDEVLSDFSDTGGTDYHGDGTGTTINQPPEIGTTGDYTPTSTFVPIPVTITDPANFSLGNITLTLGMQYPTLGDTAAYLIAPNGAEAVLWLEGTDGNGQTVNKGESLTGANIGASTLSVPGTTNPVIPYYIGTTFDTTSIHSLFATTSTAPYTGHYQPLEDLTGPFGAFTGLTAAELSGTWLLRIVAYQPQTTASFVAGASVDVTSGNSDITDVNSPTEVGISYLNSGTATFNDGIQALPTLPAPSIASDNTLGTSDPYSGRLYVAVADDDFVAATGAYTTSTFIDLYFSDDGGQTWDYEGIVNDDDGLTDGYSEGGYAVGGILASDEEGFPFSGLLDADVRPKAEPQVAVDSYTGTLVVSFLDTRNDASAVRVATYIAASTDGGGTFAPETFANPTENAYQGPVINAITGAQVDTGPIPDNQSSGNFDRDATYGFGTHQGLAVADGEIIPVWSSNQNEGSQQLNAKVPLTIESAVLNFAAGPRVIASTQGPVGQPGDIVNTEKAADGSPIANTIVITFDRPVNPASFPADGATIGSSPIQVFYNNPDDAGTVGAIPLRVLSVTPDSSDTIFTIVFDPAGHGVGTYSYILRPLVVGMIPYQVLNEAVQQVPFIDTAKNSGQVTTTVTGHSGSNLTKVSLSGQIDVYDPVTHAAGNPDDLQIFLVAQDGTQYPLFNTSTANTTSNPTFPIIPVDVSINIPGTEPLDQTYTIKVVDHVAGEQVFLYNDVNPLDFQFQVQFEGAPLTIGGNALDQNANGTPGETTADDYSVPNGRGTLPLIVPGPHVLSTSVTGVNGTVSTGTDNLVNNDNANAISVTFDRTMQVSSFTPAQVLAIVGPVGPINTPQTFASTGTTSTYTYNNVAQTIPKSGNGSLNSVIPVAGANLSLSSLRVQVNITDPNDASLSISLKAPNGTLVPLVLANTASGANFTNTTFSDTAPANGLSLTIPGAPAGDAAPYGLTYTPASPLSALAGTLINGNWTLVVTDNTTTGAAGRLNSWSLNITPQIPQGAGTSLTSTLDVADYPDNSFTIAHMAVQLNISAGKDSDLQVSLIAPNGTTVIPLILSDGGTGSNFFNTTFDDSATVPIGSGVAPFSQTYQPVGSLSVLDGMSIEGTWKLKIVDLDTGGPVATLNSWSLIATPQITVTPVNAVNGGATTFKVGFPTQTLSGNYTITLSPNILSVTPNPANPSEGTPLDTNLNAGVDSLLGIASGGTTSDKFSATSVPVAIPYAVKPAIGPVMPGVLSSQINVTDNFPIQGDTTVAGLTVSLNISYYNDPDLSVTLTAPNGKVITLFANIGKGSDTANFTNTTLSDVTTPLAPITSAAAPYFGTFNPENTLASFTTDTMGNQAFSGGTWTLKITNIGEDPGSSIDSQYPPQLLGWSLNFQKPQTNTGLGESVADQATVGFRLFNLAPSNPLANDTWTAVGPAGTTAAANPNNTTGGAATGANLGGPVSVVAVDPADPSGNTAYVGAASGGIWKTTDFLTTNPSGPTYVPLTDFGSNYSINIGSIAIFDQNNDPNQSFIIAGTGDATQTTANAGNSVAGVGFLRSTNGGTSFTLLDSSINVYPSFYPTTTYPNGTSVPSNLAGTAIPANLVGTPLPENSPFRDHIFVGTSTYKVVVDPTLLPGGGVIIYAALSGKNGGLWRSDDSGNTWQNLSAGVVPQVNGQNASATDVILDPNSGSSSTGNLDILYAAFEGVGVYISANRGLGLTEMLGNVGADNLIQDTYYVPAVPLTVPDASPNGANGRIILAKPALTDNAAQNILYQSWLYAAVENANGTFNGLYVTKDDGQNWTKADIASIPDTGLVPTVAEPTNDNTQTNNFDVTQGKSFPVENGNANFSMTIDPLNPNIVYLGGTSDYQTTGLIRVDLTDMYDAYNDVPLSDERNDGGKLALDSLGAVNVVAIGNGVPYYEGSSFAGVDTGINYVDIYHTPVTINAFQVNSTQYVFNSSKFTNDGSGVSWTPIDNLYDSPLDGSTDIESMTTIIDPLTGLTRLIVSDAQGVFTGVFNADGTLNTSGIGTDPAITGSRNGNLQDEELYDTAAQPSTLAAQAAGALFYGSGIGIADVQSDPNILSDGNLTWTVASPSYGDASDTIDSNDRGGTGIATDQTGGTTISNPTGTGPSLYEYDVPFLGGDTTNFFRVNNFGQTTGLTNNYQAQFPGTNVLSQGNGVTQLGNFTVNPLNGSQILIGSNTGSVYETTNKGIQWLQIGAASDFDGTYAATLAYGAPDPTAPQGTGNLDNFIYVGTEGGHIYVTQTGGGPWTSLSNGLDGSSIVSIYTNPNRGSHEVYAVTLDGVYYMANSIASASNPNPTWVNITGNLAQIQSNPLGDPTQAQSTLLGYNESTGQLGGLRSIVVDYRYAIPDPSGNGQVHPVLYVSGYGGVFRSLDNGQTWTVFPTIAFDSAPVDGGYLPDVDVTSLQLNLGAINPATGHPTETAGDPEVLLASTLGRGDFAIRLAPDVFSSTISLDTTLPAPNGSDSGAVRGYPAYTNVQFPYIDGSSEISNYGNVVTINLIDESNGDIIGTGTTDAFGHFSVQVASTVAQTDPSFLLDGLKTVGIQATDSSGAKGNVTTFSYTLKATPPANPTNLTLTNDSGRVTNDDISNLIPPVFSAATTEPPSTEVELVRLSLGANPHYEVVGTAAANSGSASLTDTLLASELAALDTSTIDQQLTYYVIQVDLADNFSTTLANITSDPSKLTITLDNVLPPTLPAPTLDPSTNSGTNPSANITNSTAPLFDATGLLTSGPVSPYNLELFRSLNGSTPVLVGTALPGVTQVKDTSGNLTNGVYVYYVAQVDLAGNVSLLPAQGTTVTINTTAPAVPTLALLPADDSGAPSHPNDTNVTSPRFTGTGTPGLPVVLYNEVTGQKLTAAVTVTANGTYATQILGTVADGTYTLVARITNAAGNSTNSLPLTITIKHQGPVVVPTLTLQPASDTGIKGDGVTADHRPIFIGTTDPGVIVTLYAVVNGQLSAPQATTTSSTVNGSFSFQLPFNLTDGVTQLVARSTDIEGNNGPLSSPLSVRIISVAGDYTGSGVADLTVFNPSNETYYVQNVGLAQADTTPGRDVPLQYDFNGDGAADIVAYRFNSAQYYGTLIGSGAAVNNQFGTPGVSLPVSGYYGGSGTYITAEYTPQNATWVIALPIPGGFVTQYGVANVDIPVPAAYDGSGVTEIATFRPTAVAGGDADSFNVDSFFGPSYQVSFTSPAVEKLGFVYKAGDIPAPADYDGVGKDEFAIYRPSTGQFFILNTPNPRNSATWTLRTVTLNLPGGPNANDVPVSEDYDGNGKADPTVYRPSNSTFYMIHSSTGIQQNIQFGTPGGSVAAAGPLLYRLSALQSSYASTAGYPKGVGGTPSGGTLVSSGGGGGGLGIRAESISTSSTSTATSTVGTPVTTLIVSATPTQVTTSAPVATPASIVAPAPTTPVTTAVTVGVVTPKTSAKGVTVKVKADHAVKPVAEKAKTPAKPLVVETKAHVVKGETTSQPIKVKLASKTTSSSKTGHQVGLSAAAMALQKLVLAKKGKKKA